MSCYDIISLSPYYDHVILFHNIALLSLYNCFLFLRLLFNVVIALLDLILVTRSAFSIIMLIVTVISIDLVVIYNDLKYQLILEITIIGTLMNYNKR